MVILSLVLSLSTSLLSAGFTFYNSISNPYQTFLGPLGVYTWSGLSGEYGLGTSSAPRRPLTSLCSSQSAMPLRGPLGQRGGGWASFCIFTACMKHPWKQGSVLNALVRGEERGEQGV